VGQKRMERDLCTFLRGKKKVESVTKDGRRRPKKRELPGKLKKEERRKHERSSVGRYP